MKKIIIILCCILSVGSCEANQNVRQKIEIIAVKDGDTVEALLDGRKIRIRLDNIDCFETSVNLRIYKQAYLHHLRLEEVGQYGCRSKHILQKLLFDNKDNIYFLPSSQKDKYGRRLGTLFVNNLNVNQYMLEYGGCQPYSAPKPKLGKCK